MKYKKEERKYIDTILKENKICDIIYNMSKEEFSSESTYLLLNNIFYNKNITITILTDKYVIVSKNTDPTIHFVIRHPKLCKAISNFNPLVKE